MTFRVEMDDFDIDESELDEIDVDSGDDHERLRHGSIMLGDFEQPILCSLDFWGPEQYRTHWYDAVARVVYERKNACLIESLGDPAHCKALGWWAMYPSDDDIVYIQPGLCVFEWLDAPFDLANPHASIWPRRHDEDREEWEVPIADLHEFLATHPREAWRPNGDSGFVNPG